MSIEYKLECLKDWMVYWIEMKFENYRLHRVTMDLYNETGMLIYPMTRVEVINFEKYCQLIENKNKK